MSAVSAIAALAGALLSACGTGDGFAGGPLIRELFVYVGTTAGTIESYRYDLKLQTLASHQSFAAPASPKFLAMRPQGDVLISADGTGNQLSSFGVDPLTGALQLVGSYPLGTGATSARAVAFHPSGAFVYAADYGSSKISTFAVDPSGVLTLLAVDTSGNGPFALAVNPAGNALYVANAAAGTVVTYAIATAGTLTRGSGATEIALGAGSSPGSVAVAASGAFLLVPYYVGATPKFSSFGLDAASGFPRTAAASTVAAGNTPLFATALDGVGIALLADRDDNDLRAYSLDPSSGTLGFLESTPVPGPPGELAVDSGDQLVFAAVTSANSLVRLSFDASGTTVEDYLGVSPPSATAVGRGIAHR